MATKAQARVLIIEDDMAIRKMYADCLRDEDFDVIEEDTATAAADRLIKGEHFDTIITDIMMPGMDGWEFLDYVRVQLKIDDVKLPIIVISAFDSDNLRFKAFQHKANGWFTKPIKPLSMLIEEIKIQTGRGRGFLDGTTTCTGR